MTNGPAVGRSAQDGYGLRAFGSLSLDGWHLLVSGYGASRLMGRAKGKNCNDALYVNCNNMKPKIRMKG